MLMTRHTMPRAVALAALFVLVTATVLPLQSVFGEGGARRDVIRAEEQQRQEAIALAQEAADHGKAGHVGALLTSAEAALQAAQKAGEAPHVEAGIGELKQAIEHGKAGHAEVATKHAERSVTHLSEQYRSR
jgi:Small metal-binding protein